MKKRSVLAVILLSYLTLGIYTLVWEYKTRKELVEQLQDKKAIPSFIWELFPFIAVVIVLIGLIPVLAASGGDKEANPDAIGVVFILIGCVVALASVVITFWWHYHYLKAVEKATGGTDGMMLFVMFILLSAIGLGPIWMLLVQNDINKFIDSEGVRNPQAASMGGAVPNLTPTTPQAPAPQVLTPPPGQTLPNDPNQNRHLDPPSQPQSPVQG